MPLPRDSDLPIPPPEGTPPDDPQWADWFRDIFDAVGRNGSSASSVTVRGKERDATFSPPDIFQDLLTLDCGLYANYTSSNGNAIYGFASNVRRSAGSNPVSGGQFNAWGGPGLNGVAVGAGGSAIAEDGFLGVLTGITASVVNKTHNNVAGKVGVLASFANRFGSTVSGLGSNFYNYYAHGMRLTSQPRTAANEFCGWSVGIQFLSDSFDEMTPRAWNAAVTYSAGEVVSSGGLAWKAIQASLNQAPAVPSAFWVQHTVAGAQVLAIGIDFSCLSVQTMGRMAAAMRLRDTMPIDWDVTGAIKTFFDVNAAPNPRWVVHNAGVERIGFDVVNGDIYKNGVFLI